MTNKIIDFHCHLASASWYSERFLKGVETLVSTGAGISREKAREVYDEIYDDTGENLIAEMDRAGISHSVIFPGSDYDMATGMGWAKVSIEERNEIVFDIAKRNSDRLIPFFSIDPRKVNALNLFKQALKNGAKGLKLVPGAGFYPSDKILYPFYQLAVDYGVPALIHTGPVVTPMHSKYADPYHIDEIAGDFPDLKIVCAHSAFGFWEQLTSIAMNKSNVYLELSGWQSFRQKDANYFYNSIRTMINLVGSDRIIFGTDYPFITHVILRHKEYIDAFKQIPEDIQAKGITFSKNELDNILGNTAASILNI